ncbi:MAG TPA: DUF445 domain-containing protein [Lachnospiraceae bacterium]|mgnify:CR=1 FL=1|nr:DUF445 family protein [uncultured Lachnoclostridium sp.]HAU85862.1 DUF445 domain-containing protein [Lachnospiraceae bacterium]
MNYANLITPLIGAGIGYVTNYIAVKMLFRPLRPIRIGNFKLPFTPGIIPKEKPRLAHAIGEVIGQRLVTKDGIEAMLLSEEVKNTIKSRISEALNNNNTTLYQFMIANLSEEKTDSLKENVTGEITTHITHSLMDANIDELLAGEIVKSIKEYFQGGLLAMMLNDSILNSIGTQIGKGIRNFLENNGENIIKPYVEKEYDKITELTLHEVKDFTEKNEIALEDILIHVYEYTIGNNIDKILSLIDVSQIAEEQINQMDVSELEKLILSVMKKELNAIVNLGALIGLILGLLNLVLT